MTVTHTQGEAMSWPAAFRTSAPWAGAIIGAYAAGLCGLRALIAFELGRGFLTPEFSAILSASLLTSLAMWPMLAAAMRWSRGSAMVRDSLQWLLLAGLTVLGLLAAWAAVDPTAIDVAAGVVAPDLLP